MAGIRKRDIDRIYTSLRPRLGKLGGSAVVVPTIPPHTHSADSIGSTAAGDVAAENVQAALEELAEEKLARDGHQPMTGSLDLDHFDLVNVDEADMEGLATFGANITFTGGVGSAVINNPRVLQFNPDSIGEIQGVRLANFDQAQIGEGIIDQPRVIHMTGSYNDDNEGWIDGLERLTFTGDPDSCVIDQPALIRFNESAGQVAEEGDTGWDNYERMLMVATEYVSYSEGSDNSKFPIGFTMLRCTSLPVGASEIDRGKVVIVSDVSGYVFPPVKLWVGNDLDTPAQGDGAKILGLSWHGANSGEALWVITKGRMTVSTAPNGSSSGPGSIVWADPANSGQMTFDEPTTGRKPRARIGILIDDSSGEGPWVIDVDPQIMPMITELSWVDRATDPVALDVLRFDDRFGEYQWRVTQLRGSRTVTDTETDAERFTDYLIRCDATSNAITVYLPDPSESAGAFFHIKKIDDTVNLVTIDAVTNGGTVDGEDSFDLELQGECLSVQCDGTDWAVV